MTTIVSHSELLRRAVTFISESRRDSPAKPLSSIIDEASMRFNLSPLDTEALMHLLEEDKKAPSNNPGEK